MSERVFSKEFSEELIKGLLKEVEYAKSSLSARELLYQAYGKILLAFELELISSAEYFELNRLCVREGINNPEYF